jgi:hypothetical protein
MKKLIAGTILLLASCNSLAFSFGNYDCSYYVDNGPNEIDHVNSWLSGYYRAKIGKYTSEKGYFVFIAKTHEICKDSVRMTISDAANMAHIIVEPEIK